MARKLDLALWTEEGRTNGSRGQTISLQRHKLLLNQDTLKPRPSRTKNYSSRLGPDHQTGAMWETMQRGCSPQALLSLSNSDTNIISNNKALACL